MGVTHPVRAMIARRRQDREFGGREETGEMVLAARCLTVEGEKQMGDPNRLQRRRPVGMPML